MNVAEIVYNQIISDQTVFSIVNDSVFPIRAAQNKSVPFVTYIITDISPNSGKKELSIFDDYTIEIDLFTDKYKDITILVDAIRSIFENYTFTDDNTFCDFNFITIKEDYKNDAQLYNKTIVLMAHFINK
jgi:hypothetical protein